MLRSPGCTLCISGIQKSILPGLQVLTVVAVLVFLMEEGEDTAVVLRLVNAGRSLCNFLCGVLGESITLRWRWLKLMCKVYQRVTRKQFMPRQGRVLVSVTPWISILTNNGCTYYRGCSIKLNVLCMHNKILLILCSQDRDTEPHSIWEESVGQCWALKTWAFRRFL